MEPTRFSYLVSRISHALFFGILELFIDTFRYWLFIFTANLDTETWAILLRASIKFPQTSQKRRGKSQHEWKNRYFEQVISFNDVVMLKQKRHYVNDNENIFQNPFILTFSQHTYLRGLNTIIKKNICSACRKKTILIGPLRMWNIFSPLLWI